MSRSREILRGEKRIGALATGLPIGCWLGVLVLALVAIPVGARGLDDLGDCPEDELKGARCGTYRVFEDRVAKAGRTIDLNIVVWPAEKSSFKDPLFILTGGPGQGATSMAGALRVLGAGLRAQRDIVLVDQRGTGTSNPLNCPMPSDPLDVFGSVLGVKQLASCRDALEKDADLKLYSTAVAMDDLDDVRAWLGYEHINLWGMSYGTRAAMTYMRRHAEHVRTAVLEGLVGMDQRAPLSYARDAQRAIDRLFSECEDDPGCSETFPEVRHTFRVLLDRLERGGVAASIRLSPEAEPRSVAFSRGDFGYSVRGMLYGNGGAMRLPALINQAFAESDFSGFAQPYFDRVSGLHEFVADGMYLSVLCAEDIPRFDDQEVKAATDGTFLGHYLVDDYREACRNWRRAEVPDSFLELVSSSAPTLVVSGDRDPVTPPYWAEQALPTLSAAQHIVIERVGHGVVFGNACLLGVVQAFLDEGSAEDLDLACIAEIKPPKFVLDLGD